MTTQQREARDARTDGSGGDGSAGGSGAVGLQQRGQRGRHGGGRRIFLPLLVGVLLVLVAGGDVGGRVRQRCRAVQRHGRGGGGGLHALAPLELPEPGADHV